MKKSTKLVAVALTAAAIFFGSNVKAQTTEKSAWRLGIGIEGGKTTGSISDAYGATLGGTARLQYGATDNLAITLTSGYYNFFGKEINNTGIKPSDKGMIPVKAGLKAFFTDNLYFGAEAGAGFGLGDNKVTKLILSPGLGWADKSWDVGVRYENYSGGESRIEGVQVNGSNYGQVALRVAYGFSL